MSDKLYLFAISVELLGIFIIAIGIIHCYLIGNDVGYILITAGSLLMSAGSLVFAKIVMWKRRRKSST